MRLILEEIKTVLQNKMFMTIDDIRLLARKFTIPEQEIEQYVKNIVWRKDYDEDFTEWLNAKAKRVLYGNEGLFYILPNNLTVLEDPEPSKASYVFIGDPNRVTSNIEAIRREAIQSGTYFIRDDASDPLVHYGSSAWREILYRLKKATPEKLNWFVGRVVHYDKEQWKRDMEALLHLALRLPLAQDSSVSPLEGYALEVWICNKCIHEVRVHVKLPSKQPMDGEARICPNCGAREQDLTWNKVYEADEQGNITE